MNRPIYHVQFYSKKHEDCHSFLGLLPVIKATGQDLSPVHMIPDSFHIGIHWSQTISGRFRARVNA